MRSPSGTAEGRMRGLAPTDTTMVSALISSKSVLVLPLLVDTTTRLGPSSRPSPWITVTPALMSWDFMSSDC